MSDGEAFSPVMRAHCQQLESALGSLLEARRAAMHGQGLSFAEQASVMVSALATGFGAVLLGMVSAPARHGFVHELAKRLHVTLLRHATHKSMNEMEDEGKGN